MSTITLFAVLCAGSWQPSEGLTWQNYELWKDRLALTAVERAYQTLPWEPGPKAAFEMARATNKPLLIWIADGDPLGATSTYGVRARVELWRDRGVASGFILLAMDLADLRLSSAGEEVAAQLPSGAKEGVLILDPMGKRLGFTPTLDPLALQSVLDEARTKPRAPSRPSTQLWPEPSAPKGLRLRVLVKDVQKPKTGTFWHERAYNLGWLVVPDAELDRIKSLIRGREGQSFSMSLRQRWASRDFLDRVRGKAQPFEENSVQKSDLSAKCTAENRYQFQGKFTSSESGAWSLDGANDVQERTRGMDITLLGQAVWDPKSSRWTKFEWVAVGTRWGGSPFNQRMKDEGVSEIGFLATLAE